ncbi:ABC transporter ATP-binding protein [Paenibacillus sp. ACRRX]|uniref:ABC transporter ATP-binding protein n=1 Tax=Paenibacillus sp. ACRRX TaxID=2918206 RepID=UPI001EF4C202|nr:ABC transporter ATP-binding protein [Paenibacillus sp. ACRRX]MCG7409977.1 ABC transporter ATP-binding protein [Paenibacillus sp. ACRRX]
MAHQHQGPGSETLKTAGMSESKGKIESNAGSDGANAGDYTSSKPYAVTEVPVIAAAGLYHSYGGRQVLHDVSLSVQAGEWLGIIGPNGSGKSTLLSLLSNAETPSKGAVSIYGKAVHAYKRKELSRLMAVLQQEALPPVHFTVRDIVEMGRFPYQSWFGSEREDSGLIVDHIMSKLQLEQIADRPLDRLSGGQRQRAALGKLMAQSPSIVLLDEPTTYLDIRYQVQFMDVIRDWQQDCGLTVVSVLHDLNLAALYCDRIMVMQEGVIAAEGTPQQLMTTELLQHVFDTKTVIVPHPDCSRPQVLVCPGSVGDKQ